MQEIGFFSSHSNGVFHPFEIVPRKVFILTWALIAFALGVWSNLDFQQCFCRLIVWLQVLLLPCSTKRRPGRSYLCNAGVRLGNFGSRSVPMATMARLCQSHHDPPPRDERVCLQDFRSQTRSAGHPLPTFTKWTICAVFDTHKWHQDPDGGICCHQGDWRRYFFGSLYFPALWLKNPGPLNHIASIRAKLDCALTHSLTEASQHVLTNHLSRGVFLFWEGAESSKQLSPELLQHIFPRWSRNHEIWPLK